MKKMFVTDLDGTLFTDDKKIHDLDLKALERLGEIGVTRVFATGRSLYSFQKAVEKIGFASLSNGLPFCSESHSLCNELPAGCKALQVGNDMTIGFKELPVDYVIFSTGAGIMQYRGGGMRSDGDSIIQNHSLDSCHVSSIADCFDLLKLDYMIHRPVPDTPYCIYRQQSGRVNPDFTARIELYRDFTREIDHTGPVREFGPATELLTIVPAEQGHNMADMIERSLPNFSVIRATSPLDGRSLWVEVFNRSVSKSQSISWLADQLGILRQDVVSIGNDYNDLDMLSWSGQSFVVANAPEAFKERFTSVASNNGCGVSQAIKSIL